jgi:hypothetical protein
VNDRKIHIATYVYERMIFFITPSLTDPPFPIVVDVVVDVVEAREEEEERVTM